MQKFDFVSCFKPGFAKLTELRGLLKESSLDRRLQHLIDIYASQLNGCAFCVDMHVKEAKIDGERELRIYHLPVWHESPLFSEKEKAALKWTKALTRLSDGPVSDEIYESVKKHFSDQEMSELTMAIGLINVWNRFAAPFTVPPGAMDKMMGLEKANLK